MYRVLKILTINRSDDDALLIFRHLRQDCYEMLIERVGTEAELKTALSLQNWDLVLCDYQAPKLPCARAFEVVKQHDPYLPFLLISGLVGLQEAEKIFRVRADNYISKDNLGELSPAIEEEVARSRIKRRLQTI